MSAQAGSPIEVTTVARRCGALPGEQMSQVKTDEHGVEPTDAMLLMRHVHQYGFESEGCTWQLAKQKGDRSIRRMGSKKFAEVVRELVALGFGVIKIDKPLTYCSLKEMANISNSRSAND